MDLCRGGKAKPVVIVYSARLCASQGALVWMLATKLIRESDLGGIAKLHLGTSLDWLEGMEVRCKTSARVVSHLSP